MQRHATGERSVTPLAAARQRDQPRGDDSSEGRRLAQLLLASLARPRRAAGPNRERRGSPLGRRLDRRRTRATCGLARPPDRACSRAQRWLRELPGVHGLQGCVLNACWRLGRCDAPGRHLPEAGHDALAGAAPTSTRFRPASRGGALRPPLLTTDRTANIRPALAAVRSARPAIARREGALRRVEALRRVTSRLISLAGVTNAAGGRRQEACE